MQFNLRVCAVNSKSICEFANLCIYAFVELRSYECFILNVNRKGIYFIWVRLKSRKVELKQQVKVSLEKYFGMFCHDCSYNIRVIFTNTKPSPFRIPKKQNIPNTPSRCLNFSFSVFNLNCLQVG